MIVKINSYTVTIEAGSLHIHKPLTGRKTASFNVIDIAGSELYIDGQIVEIEDNDANTVFSGVIDGSESEYLFKSGGLLHIITCKDWHYLAEKRRAAQSYLSQTAGYIADDLYDKYLAAEGVSIGAIQSGPTIEQSIMNYVRLSDAFDALAELSLFWWDIDDTKAFYFIDRATNSAPWSISPGSTDILDDPKPRIKRGNPDYRNRQYIRGVKAITTTQTENFIADGISQTFSVGYPISATPIITVDSVAQEVGIKGVDEDSDVYWSKGDPVLYFAYVPDPDAVIEVNYEGEWNLITLSSDNAEIFRRKLIEGGAGTGYVDDVEDEQDTLSREAAFQTAAARLLQNAKDANKFIFYTERPGLLPGQILPVDYPRFSLDTEMLITNVDIEEIDGILRYTVESVEGPDVGDWTQFFKKMSDKRIIIDKINLGEEANLIILESLSETTGWQESVNVDVFACPIPSSSLYPSSTLYPC
jgi:hypothetical protein